MPPLLTLLDLIWSALEASAQAYQPPRDVIVLSAHSTDTRLLIRRQTNATFVAFRGTADLRNWVTDLDCPLAFFPSRQSPEACYNESLSPSPRVHAGFLQAWLSIKAALLPFLAAPAAHPLVFTGHSLGGALAMLAAFDLQSHGSTGRSADPAQPAGANRLPPIAACLTFGQPRVGDADFALLYNALLGSRTWRVTNADDLVPRLPWFLGAYRHAGHEIFFPAALAGQPILDPAWFRKLPSDLLCLARAIARGRLALLACHRIASYLNRLAATPASFAPLSSASSISAPFLTAQN